MKKVIILLAVVCITCALSAQNVQESMVDFNKQQISGYTISISSASEDLVEAALKEKMEKQYSLKSSKANGFKAYLNQPFQPFGAANYDIYTNIEETGKKSNKTIVLTMIVCSGNLNAITSVNNAETAAAIKKFLSDFASYVTTYSINVQIEAVNAKLSKLNNEKTDLQNQQSKITKEIEKLNKDLDEVKKDLDENDKNIQTTQDELNNLQKQLK